MRRNKCNFRTSSYWPRTEKGTTGMSHTIQGCKMLKMRTSLNHSWDINASSQSNCFFPVILNSLQETLVGELKLKTDVGQFSLLSYAHTANFCSGYYWNWPTDTRNIADRSKNPQQSNRSLHQRLFPYCNQSNQKWESLRSINPWDLRKAF